MRRAALLGLAALLLVAAERRTAGAPDRGYGLLGPLGPPLAQAQFVRARLAREAGLEGRCLARMQAGLALDPGSLSGRLALADLMGLTLSSAEGGRPGTERRAWLEEALALLEDEAARLEARGEALPRNDDHATSGRGPDPVEHGDHAHPRTVAPSDPVERAGLLRFHAGLLLMAHAETDPDLPWAGGAAGLWLAAAARFHDAAGLGHPDAGAAEAYALRQAEAPTRE